MLSTPPLRPGLPSTPRPNKAANSAQNSPYILSPDSSARYLAPAPQARSHSQPPRGSSPHGHSPSYSMDMPNNGDARNELVPRGREQHRPSPAVREKLNLTPRSGVPISRSESPHPLSRDSSPGIAVVQPDNSQVKTKESNEDGNAIWNAVSAVANILNINTSKAWSSTLPSFAGEETPPGQDSSLTRAMKAYHIAKARGPSDLPDWLFNERERRTANNQVLPADVDSDRAQLTLQNNDPASGKGRATPPPLPQELTSSFRQPRGADRLKAMRDARRTREPETSRINHTNNGGQPFHETLEKKPRIGLPSGPHRGRR